MNCAPILLKQSESKVCCHCFILVVYYIDPTDWVNGLTAFPLFYSGVQVFDWTMRGGSSWAAPNMDLSNLFPRRQGGVFYVAEGLLLNDFQ